MSARSFRSVFMVATCAGAALGCYLVSLRVASERSSLEDVENRIVLAQRDVRLLQTEIGTRGRLAQLERWNVKVLALSAPAADQFLEGSFQLATLTKPKGRDALAAPVVLASASSDPAARPHLAGVAPAPAAPDAGTDQALAPDQLLHVASYKVPDGNSAPKKSVSVALKPKIVAKPAAAGHVEAKGPPARTAMIDPLAPRPDKPSGRKAATPRAGTASEADKD